MISRNDVESEEMTCAICPTQWQGRLKDGRCFYFRYRFGRVGMGVGQSHLDAEKNSYFHEAQYGNSLGGYMDQDEYVKWFDTLGGQIV